MSRLEYSLYKLLPLSVCQLWYFPTDQQFFSNLSWKNLTSWLLNALHTVPLYQDMYINY